MITFPCQLNGFYILCMGTVSIEDQQHLIVFCWFDKLNEMLQPSCEDISVHPSTVITGNYTARWCTISQFWWHSLPFENDDRWDLQASCIVAAYYSCVHPTFSTCNRSNLAFTPQTKYFLATFLDNRQG